MAAPRTRSTAQERRVELLAAALSEFAVGGLHGTSTEAIAKRARPDLRVVPLRGNVETRLRKLDDGEVDATILALAGLKRLGLMDHATTIMSAEEFLPAVGQGAIGIEARENDKRTRGILARIDHADTSIAIAAERAFLAELDGSCKTPIGGNAMLSGDVLQFRGLIAKPDGSAAHETAVAGGRMNLTINGGIVPSNVEIVRRRCSP